MPRKIRIESTLTVILGKGKLDLYDQQPVDLNTTTVGDIKEELQDLVPYNQQSLYWKGYILDQDDLTLVQACVGVNGECISDDSDNDETLVIFLTVPLEKYQEEDQQQQSSIFSLSSSSLLYTAESPTRQQRTFSNSLLVVKEKSKIPPTVLSTSNCLVQ